MIPDLTRTELAARLRSSIEGKEAWDYVAANVGLVASAVQFMAPSAGIADAMIADAKRQLGEVDVCAEMRALCSYCGGTGDVHTIAGEWRGSCDCEASQWARDALDAERYRWLRQGDNDEQVLQRGPVDPSYVYLPRKEKLDKLIDIAMAPATPVPLETNPSEGPSDDKILDALVEALDVDRAGAMKLILRVAGAHLDEREVA